MTWRRLPLHPVWARIPGTARVMAKFSKARYFLYLDSDAVLIHPQVIRPRDMYRVLVQEDPDFNQQQQQKRQEHAQSGSRRHLHPYHHYQELPALVINKPYFSWWASQCMKFNGKQGCFISGALLWQRSPRASLILNTWWESRNHKAWQDFSVTVLLPQPPQNNTDVKNATTTTIFDTTCHRHKTGPDKAHIPVKNEPHSQPMSHPLPHKEDCLVGWDHWDHGHRRQSSMREQNRLMYIYATIPAIQDAIWAVPREDTRARSYEMFQQNKPCLQCDAPEPHNDGLEWNVSSNLNTSNVSSHHQH